ncbi:MAG: SAM-dependent methyltransferase, partial [Blautia sp.]|nr:SAM-dependent methyltransferase [Blautia sp.]
MQLSLRLKAIADLVTPGNRLVDVGCDHGYLPVYLVQESIIPSAIAMDVRKGPLERARANIRMYGYEAFIKTRMSDGLAELRAGEGETLVIAGMGGPLMESILAAKPEVRESFREMILQPQSDI